jgi:uncharacterized protein YwgA
MKRDQIRGISNNILLTLATLYFHKNPIKGRTRFQKTIYLLQKEYDVSFDFDFRPYYYGPYSDELSDIFSLLRAMNFVEERTEYFGMGITRYSYRLTEKGRKYFKMYESQADRETVAAIGKIQKEIPKVSKLPTPNLIAKSKQLMRG